MRYLYILILRLKWLAGSWTNRIWLPKGYTDKIRNLTLIQTLELEILIIVLLISVGTYLLMHFEHIRMFDAFYLSVITLAWVGYGDVVPHSVGGRIVVMVYAILGMPVFILTMSIIVSHMMDKIKISKKWKRRTHKHQVMDLIKGNT